MVDSTTTVQIPASSGSGAAVQLPSFQQLLGLGNTSAPLVHESALFQMTPPDPALMLSHRLPLVPNPTPPPLPSILQPVQGLPAYQMPSPIQGYAREQLIAQGPSGWVSDATPQPAPQPKEINPAPGYGVNPQQAPPDNWQPPTGPAWGFNPQAVYKQLAQQRPDSPESDAYARLLRAQTLQNQQVAQSPPPVPAPYVGHLGYQQQMAAAAPPGAVPGRNFSPTNMWRNFSHGALTGFNSSLGQQEAAQNRIIQQQNDSRLQAWASRTNNASTTAMSGAKTLAEESNKKAAKFYEKMMELGAKFMQVPSIENMHNAMKHILGSTMPNSRAREEALRAYSEMLHMNLVTPQNMNAFDQDAMNKFKKDAEEIKQKQLDNEYDQNTLQDRIAEKKADSRKALADANVAEKTQDAKIATATLEMHSKQQQLELDQVYAEPMKRQALLNQMAQTQGMLRTAARAAFDGTQKQIQDFNNLEKQKLTALQTPGKEGQMAAARIEQEIQDLYGARPHGVSKHEAFFQTLNDPMNAMGLRPFLPASELSKPNGKVSRDAWVSAYEKAGKERSNPYAQGLINRIDEAGSSIYLQSASGAPASVQGLYTDLKTYGNKLKQLEAQGPPALPETIRQRKDRFARDAEAIEIKGASPGVMAGGELAPPMEPIPASAMFLAGTSGPDGLAAQAILDKAGYKDNKPIDWSDPLIREAFLGEVAKKGKR